MARARNIKPSFFTNEILGTLDPIIGMTFIGLWCLADRNGRLEDRPLRIKAELFPYRDGTDVNGYLTVLEQHCFVDRYEVDGVRYIQIVNFGKHQAPHHTERAKGYPPKPAPRKGEKDLTVKPPLDDGESQVPTRSDSLNHDSLIPDSLNHESSASPGGEAEKPAQLPTREGVLCKRLREIGIDAAPHQLRHPGWIDLLAAHSDEDIIGAAELVKERKGKGQRIGINYLVPILMEPPKPPPTAGPKGSVRTIHDERKTTIDTLTGRSGGNGSIDAAGAIPGESKRIAG